MRSFWNCFYNQVWGPGTIDTDLSGSEFRVCNFENCRFYDLNFSGTVFKKCRFNQASFTNCDLTGVKFEDCHWGDNEFRQCELEGVDLQNIPRYAFVCNSWYRLENSNVSLADFCEKDTKSEYGWKAVR